jgi:hypothetical protein
VAREATVGDPSGVCGVWYIRTGEPGALSQRVMTVFVLMTVSDFGDQCTHYQGKIFHNYDGRLEYADHNWATTGPRFGPRPASRRCG